ncbi:MAG TPA: tetratricopeptide repeat protein, partial [Limnochordia bacterium]|nr:tetratricopeptide repeat protein [Limnochordia bacterium]
SVASVAAGLHGLRALRANRLAAVASVLRSVGRDAEAHDDYQTILRLAPWDAQSAVALASMTLEQGDATTALAWLHRAQAGSADSDAWLIEASAWQQLDQPQKAIAVLEGAVAALPDDIQARLRLGNLYALAGRTDAALVAYRRVLASDQDSEQAQLIKREAERAARLLAAMRS